MFARETAAAPAKAGSQIAPVRADDSSALRKSGTPANEISPLVQQVLASPGQPLDAATRAYFEPRFQQDFSSVRIHTDARASESARQINSAAYTSGHNVVFRSDMHAPDTLAGRKLMAHELTHVVQQRYAVADAPLRLGMPGDRAEQQAEAAANGLMSQATLSGSMDRTPVVRRAPAPTVSAPTPPAWLGALRARAVWLFGDVWDVEIPSLGRSPVGPHNQMQAYLRAFNQTRLPGVEAMESAHIVGGEHMRDLGWGMQYENAPTIGVAASLHDKWTREVSNHQSKIGMMGGRATPTVGRPVVGPQDVVTLYDEVYRGIPELQQMSRRIIESEAQRIMSMKFGMPKPTSPMDVHQGGMRKPTSPMDAHQGGMRKPTSPMDMHQGGMLKPTSPMDVHQGGMPKPTSPMDAHQGGMPKPNSPMDVHQGGMPKPSSPMDVHKGGMPKPTSPMDAHQGGMPKPVLEPPGPGFLGRRLNAAKIGIKSGLRGAVSAPNLASLLPHLILAIADKVAAEEMIKTIQVKFIKEGFAKGVAAGVMRWSQAEAKSNLMNQVTEFRIQNLHDPAGFLKRSDIFTLAQAYENYGVEVGYWFSSNQSPKWKDELRKDGLDSLAKQNYHFGEDPQALFEYPFIDKLAYVIRARTNAIVGPAIKFD